MNIKVSFAIMMCKFSRFILRKLGRGGTNLPGVIALKICPDLLGRLSKGVTCIVVTGTNGKTTSSRMIEQSMTDAGISFFANRTGANMLGGVTAEFAAHSTNSGKVNYTHALIEADEAAFKTISKFIDAKVIVVTNVFRDQLDRYGEVTTTLDNIRISIKNCPNAILCLNADDSISSSLRLDEEIKNHIMYYGVDTAIYKNRVQEVSDAPYCHCGSEYEYDYVTYGHLGGYRCPNCGYCRPTPEVSVSKIVSTGIDQSQIEFSYDGKTYPATVNLPGGYNIYNSCDCFAASIAMGIDPQTAVESLGKFACGFGRMEKFDINNTDVRMILIKNPAGCNQVLNYLTNTSDPAVFVACLNDGAQDGKDVSWIWDVDFERLLDMGDNLKDVYVSGDRAEDMALRFKYAGVPTDKIHLEKDYFKLMDMVTSQDTPVFIMPTYTAMLKLRSDISKKYGFKEFWE